MKKCFAWFISGLMLAALSSGCLFFGDPQKAPKIYDLPLDAEKVSMHPLRIGSIRNLSGADRRIQLRENGTQIRQVEDHLWLLTPTSLIERKLKERFSVNAVSDKVPQLSATLRHFEFDLDKKEALFSITYDVMLPDKTRILIDGNYHEKVHALDCADAMNRAIRRSMDDLDAALQKIEEKKKK